MAHETLKSLIRQYINTNGQEAITGQILQDVLIEMVNETPVIGAYLPLTGGTITGTLNVSPSAGSEKIIEINGISITLDNSSNTTTINANSVTSPAFIVPGGTSSGFLKADGSVDRNTYISAGALSNYLPLGLR